jgi:hypothetical protein
MRNTTLHSPRGRRSSGSVWIADPRATKSCIVSRDATVNKGAPSSLPLQKAVIRGDGDCAAGAGGSSRPDVAEVVRMQFEVLHSLTATTCVPVGLRVSGSCSEHDGSVGHAQAFARGTR